FCYRIKKYIGSYFASLNGADAIIFTGGIGENAAPIRKKVLENLDHLGIKVDDKRNADLKSGNKISTDDSKTDVFVIPTNEELVIAIDAAKIALASKQTPWA